MNYKTICSNLLKGLPQRTIEVIERRFGLLNSKGERETLEAIGQSQGITRERVRQIESEGFSKIKPKLENYQKVFQSFSNTLDSFGGLKREDALLSCLGGEKNQNQVFFLLNIADGFERFSESKDFYPFWAKDKKPAVLAEKVVNLILNRFRKDESPLTLDELFKVQKIGLCKVSKKMNKEVFNSCLEVSKKIEQNPEGQFGLRDWVEITPRGVKDKAYLVLKKQGKPLHFSKVTILIENLPFPSQRKTHIATVHNELIKDQRFVLVGRGLYGLREWGYEPGVVRDIIVKVLQEANKPLAKEEILGKVLEQRFVKKNTILLNLQDRNYFLKDPQGKYKVSPVREHISNEVREA